MHIPVYFNVKGDTKESTSSTENQLQNSWAHNENRTKSSPTGLSLLSEWCVSKWDSGS